MNRAARMAIAMAAALSLAPAGLASATGQHRADRVSRLSVESLVEAGYTARFVDRGSPLPVAGTVTVPTLTCGPSDTGVVTSVGLLEVPYRFAGGRIYAWCADGAPAYEARLESSAGPGVDVDGLVEAGDRVKITAIWNGDVGLPEVDVTMVGLDRGWRANAQFDFIADGFNAAGFRQTPMWSDGAALPVADAIGARVVRARVDRQDLGDRAVTRSVLVDAAGDRIVRPSKIKSGGRFSFSYVR